MNCQNQNEGPVSCGNTGQGGSSFLIIIVLYILLAIILGSRSGATLY